MINDSWMRKNWSILFQMKYPFIWIWASRDYKKNLSTSRIPHKKPRGKELTEEQKQSNREKSNARVKCEHTISGIKRYKAATAVYRNHIRDLDDHFMVTAAGLWNFYLMAA